VSRQPKTILAAFTEALWSVGLVGPNDLRHGTAADYAERVIEELRAMGFYWTREPMTAETPFSDDLRQGLRREVAHAMLHAMGTSHTCPITSEPSSLRDSAPPK
jgi:hypothetical protein